MKAKIYNYKCWISETNTKTLKCTLKKTLNKSRFVVLDYSEHFFTPFGFSANWLISESHLAVHTWPEEGKSYVELSSCNKLKQKVFVDMMKDTFNILASKTSEF